MKKSSVLLFVSLFVLGVRVYAQRAEVGLSGGYGTTWLLNKNVFDKGQEVDPVISGGANFGLAANIYFNKKVGLGIELNNATVTQKYKGVIAGKSYDGKTKISFLDIPLLLKLKSGNSGFYFEIGPKISYTLAAQDYSGSGLSSFSLSSGSVKADYSKTLFSGVIGIGGRINIVDALTLSMGVRFSGTFTDATRKYEQGQTYPSASFAGMQANTNNSGALDYTRTTIASGGIQIGLLYRIGK